MQVHVNVTGSEDPVGRRDFCIFKCCWVVDAESCRRSDEGDREIFGKLGHDHVQHQIMVVFFLNMYRGTKPVGHLKLGASGIPSQEVPRVRNWH